MLDTINPISTSGSKSGDLRRLRDNVDVILLLVVFVALAYVTTSYGEAGLFPFVFLVGGVLFMTVELVSHFLPGKYRESVRNMLTRELGEVDLSDDEEETIEEAEKSLTDVLSLILLLGGFFLVTHFVNFLVATILFTLVTGYLFGLRDYRLVVLTVVLAAIIYGIFGQIINTPVLA